MKQEGTTAEVDSTGITDQTNGTMVGLEPGESLVFRIFVRLASGNPEDTVDQDREYEGTDGELMLLRNGQREADDDADGVWAFENTPDGEVVLERIPDSAVEETGPSLQVQAKSMVQSFFSSSGIAPTSLGDNVHSNSAGSISSMVSTAASSSGNSAPSSSLALVAPRILQVFAASSSEVVVTWDPVNDVGVTKYQIHRTRPICSVFAAALKTTSGVHTASPARAAAHSDGKVSANSSSDEDEKTSFTRRPSSSNGKKPQSMTPAPQSAPMRTGSTILDKAVAVASRLRRRSNSSNNHQVETQPDETSLSKEDDEHDDDRKSEPSSRYVNLASWKSSSNNADKDFHFYHATRFEEQDEEAHRQLSNLGDRELVITSSALVVLDVKAATREGFALVEEWRPLTSLTKVEERNDLDNSLVFHFKEQIEVTPDSAERSDQIIVVVDEAKACAKVVKSIMQR
ncbi:hypothetical protein GQ600_18436 [Phytophthora cactorum]|nr:hypothetical protein GQ600_18436 [Phytophthora cactorum]